MPIEFHATFINVIPDRPHNTTRACGRFTLLFEVEILLNLEGYISAMFWSFESRKTTTFDSIF